MRFLPPLAIVLLVTGCGPTPEPVSGPPAAVEVPFTAEGRLAFVRDGNPLVTITIEIADDDSTRTRGLMQRSGLPENSGMLFIFPLEEVQSFWMANTQMALDLVFVDGQGRIDSIARYAKPLSTEPVVSAGPARYVVEVEAGFADTWGLVEGDSVDWERY